ncbi:MAG: DUF2628 domain-containing protein [Alphaproteobacteria bacterium]|jgi:hypothetical protein|nr:DUF2628 domain-containing protein [Alphaproteobacteria bacterium]MDP6831404.1 DUF2628 domain-containing protein [Alphaproteobacteria bacterium]MDP6874484.1 DUF2628 domain-containing protein [Alphaproteobacteria bacterium]
MRLYTVQHRPNDTEEMDPDVVLIKEGFCWPALFMPIIWLLYRKQFWGLLAYLLLMIGFSVLIYVVGLGESAILLLSLVLALLVAAQANDWRRWRLSRRGYELVTVVAAGSLRQAEETFFHRHWQGPKAENQPSPQPTAPLPASALTPFATPFDPV